MDGCDVNCIKFIHSWTEKLGLQWAFVTEGGVLNTKMLHLLACCFPRNIDVAQVSSL